MGQAKQSTLVGMVGPLTGPRAAYGELLRNAASVSELAMIWEDDAANPECAREAAHRLVERGVGAVIGHFNSECARAAGPIYQAAGIPLLLPAATAPDLCQATGAYRLCASERQQIAAVDVFLRQRELLLDNLWSDGSVYGDRLATALQTYRAGAEPVTDRQPIIALMGAHHAVARQIRQQVQPEVLYLVPDDCVIAEFDDLLHGTGVTTLCPHATPDFSECVQLALQHVTDAFACGVSVAEFLQQHADFEQRQYRHAGFTLVQRHYQPSNEQSSGK